MQKQTAIAFLVAFASALTAVSIAPAHADGFKVCNSVFALCTIAACDPIPGSDKQVACHCTVNRGYSVGHEPCQNVKETPDGQQIQSRYYPIKSYAVCSNDRSWATCLDKPCIVDKNNPEAALCTCDVLKNQGDYMIVTSKYTPDTCTAGVMSSATVQQHEQVTDYLKTKAKNLPPFPTQMLNK
jgi:uncharacterized membrane protein